jgi:hypothetical protein
MKQFREYAVYGVYCVVMALLAMAFAVFWHDFSSAFHMTLDRESKRK